MFMIGRKRSPFGGGSIVTRTIDDTLWKMSHPDVPAEEAAAQAKLAEGMEPSPELPDPNGEALREAERQRLKKAKGSGSPMMIGKMKAPGKATLLGGY